MKASVRSLGAVALAVALVGATPSAPDCRTVVISTGESALVCEEKLFFEGLTSDDQPNATLSETTGRGELLEGTILVPTLVSQEQGHRWHVNEASSFAILGEAAELTGVIHGNIDALVIDLEFPAEDCVLGTSRLDYLYVPKVTLRIDGKKQIPPVTRVHKRDCERAPLGLTYERYRYEWVDLGLIDVDPESHEIEVVPQSADDRYLDVGVGVEAFSSRVLVNSVCLEDLAEYWPGGGILPAC